MSIRYDATSDTLRVSVTDLVRERRAPSAALTGPQRAELGRNTHILHAEMRASTLPGYEPEQTVALELALEGATVHLTGRVDGVWRGGDNRPVLEEVKLRPLGPDELPLPGDHKQLLLYLWIWRQLHPEGHDPIGRLTYLDPFADTSEEFSVERTIHLLDELKLELYARLGAMLRGERAEASRLQALSHQAKQVAWPFGARRPLQEEMEEAVESALTNKRHLILEAPTGSGKTAPLLITALRQCVRHGWRLAFATSRTAQQADRLTLIEAALGGPGRLATRVSGLEQGGSGFQPRVSLRVVLLGSRDRIGAGRPGDFAEQEIDLYEPPPWFRARLDDPAPLVPEETRAVAGEHGIDAGLIQSAFARAADVLIGDINLFFGRGGHHAGWFDPGRFARPTVLLVDEAHNLPVRMRDQYAGGVSMKDIARIADEAAFLASPWSGGLLNPLNTLAQQLDLHLKDLAERGTVFELHESGDPEFAVPLAQFRLHSAFLLSSGITPETREAVYRILRAEFAANDPLPFSAYLDASAAALHWELMDTGHVLGPTWEGCRSAILFSATLSPLPLALRECGLAAADTELLSLHPPVDHARQRVIRYVGLETTWRRREESLPDLCNLLAGAAQQTRGAWLVFFPSRSYLEQARAGLAYHEISVTLLQPGLTSAMLKFLDREQGPRLHLAVLGGKYAEGFDPPPGLYTGAAVVSIGIPPPNIRGELLNLFERHDDDALVSPYLVAGLRRVRQAAGRLFRSPEQGGVLLLIDSRFVLSPVENLLGEPWNGSEVVADPARLSELLARWADENTNDVHGQPDMES